MVSNSIYLRRVVGIAGIVSVGLLASCVSKDLATGGNTRAAKAAALPGTCVQLVARLGSMPNTQIVAVEPVIAGQMKTGGQAIAEHCLVTGKVNQRISTVDGQPYAISFELRLPKQWNGRFYHQGNGGVDGVVRPALGETGGGPVTGALSKGFAVLSSDAGHSSPGAAFGIDPQARLDYGYQAVSTLTPIAKKIIQSTYGKGPDKSYFGGCSNGGRHGMIAAVRSANDYDGILAGAPGYNLPKAALANIAGGKLYAQNVTVPAITTPAHLETAFTVPERHLLSRSILARCDALDGSTDGLVQDTAACQSAFNLQRDVPTCSGARDGTCLSGGQKSAIGQIFSGPKTESGKLIYASFPYDPGINGVGITFWEFTAPLMLDSGAVGAIFKVPPVTYRGFNGPAFSLNANLDQLLAEIHQTSAQYTESAMSFMTPPNAHDLSTLRNRGGKIIAYHGVSDAIFSINDTETWFKNVQAANADKAQSFARFYPVPGMGHCQGGPATDQFDLLESLVDWVENGKAPQAVTATARKAGNPGGANVDVPANWSATRTRPLCPYPSVARYAGTGSIEDASSFQCK